MQTMWEYDPCMADDPEPQRAYRGDGEDTPGINIYKAT